MEFVELVHIPHGPAHIMIPICTPTGSHQGPWNSLVLYLGETIGGQSPIDTAIGAGFYKLLSIFGKSYTPHMSKFYMQTFGNCRNKSETAPISLYFVRLSTLGKPGFVYISVIFSAVNTCVTHGIPSLFHVLTNFVHVGPISMFTNRPCHGPWIVIESRGFRCVSFPVSQPNVVAGVSGRNYTCINSSKLQSSILLDKRIHIYGQYNFLSMSLPSINVVIHIYFVYYSPWRIRIWCKKGFLFGGSEGREFEDPCRYWCHLINIAEQSIWDRSRICLLKYLPI